VVVGGRVMVCGGLQVMLNGRVFVLLCHSLVLRQEIWKRDASSNGCAARYGLAAGAACDCEICFCL
jgi:hypothetical protein